MKTKMVWMVEGAPTGEKWPANVGKLVHHKDKAECDVQAKFSGGIVRRVKLYA